MSEDPRCECGRLSFLLMPRATRRACLDVARERDAQRAKWGEQDHDLPTFLTILGEEVGEACKAELHTRFGGPEAGKLREELIQVAAVAVQIVEAIDRRAREST